jgi:hypothetical protein
VGGLAHYIEDEGIATIQISLIREHTEKIRPPRALWVPFDLGRPLGVPNDPEFQSEVLRHALNLFKAETGPVLEDFPRDAPGTRNESMPVACPVNFGPNPETALDPNALRDGLIAEIEGLRPWYEVALKQKNRTTTGVSGLSTTDAAEKVLEAIEGKSTTALEGDDLLPERLRMACEDIKAYYFEAVSAQPGQPTDSKSLSDWFWGETIAAQVINRLREICLADSSGRLSLLGKLLLVPRNQLHRFSVYPE